MHFIDKFFEKTLYKLQIKTLIMFGFYTIRCFQYVPYFIHPATTVLNMCKTCPNTNKSTIVGESYNL